jgi:hypothetical protein
LLSLSRGHTGSQENFAMRNKHEKARDDERKAKRGSAKAIVSKKAPKNKEGGVEAEGVAPHQRKPRTSPDSKKRTAQRKPANTDRPVHGRTAKGGSTTSAQG